jgi:predicted HTH transcriptional regulator
MCKLIENLLKEPESKTVEFKRDLSSIKPIIKTIIAFANTAGGAIIIGVEDGGKVIGIDDPLKAEERLASAISDNIAPLLMPEIEITTIKNKTLLIIQVAHTVGPFYLKQFGEPVGILVRLGSTNRQASPPLIDDMKRLQFKQSFDELPCLGATEKDFDDRLLHSVFKNFKYKPTAAKLKSLGLLVSHGRQTVPSNAGIILFANDEARWKYFADARVSCARFAGKEKVDFIDRIDIEGGILAAVDDVPKFIRRNTRMAAEIKDIKRKDIPEYPVVAVREVLLNALLHADYSCQGSRILVAIFADRLDITNPGMLPLGMTLEDLKNGVSRVRNKTIARIFAELGWAEKWGSGYKRIVKACKKGGYPIPKWEEFGSAVRVTFYPHHATKGLGARPAPSRDQVGAKLELPSLTKRQAEIVTIIQQAGEVNFRKIVAKMQEPPADRTLRDELARLKQLKLIDSKGFGRGALWYPLVKPHNKAE